MLLQFVLVSLVNEFHNNHLLTCRIPEHSVLCPNVAEMKEINRFVFILHWKMLYSDAGFHQTTVAYFLLCDKWNNRFSNKAEYKFNAKVLTDVAKCCCFRSLMFCYVAPQTIN